MIAESILRSQTRAIVQAMREVWSASRQPADRVLADFLRRHREYGGRDRRLIGDTVFGCLRWWGWLGSRTPPLDGPNGNADAAEWARLFLAAARLEQIPDAPIHAFWARAAGLPETPPARPESDPAARAAGVFAEPSSAFAVESLVPPWVLAAVAPPRAAADWIGWMQRRPPIWLRVQSDDPAAVAAELRAAGLAVEPHPRLPGALRLEGTRVNLNAVEAYRSGRVEVQDLAAQAVAEVCAAGAGESWWDLCAGAGGKTLVLARQVGASGTVLATDVRSGVLDELRRRARRAGVTTIKTRISGNVDPGSRFDGVLVDAPCTGSGTWRRNPWARWRLEAADLARHAQTQRALLEQAAPHVRSGGVLLYATCSCFTAENGGVVGAFLDAHPELAPEPFEHPLEGGRAPGLLQIWPWDGDGDAMFVARLRRVKP